MKSKVEILPHKYQGTASQYIHSKQFSRIVSLHKNGKENSNKSAGKTIKNGKFCAMNVSLIIDKKQAVNQ